MGVLCNGSRLGGTQKSEACRGSGSKYFLEAVMVRDKKTKMCPFLVSNIDTMHIKFNHFKL